MVMSLSLKTLLTNNWFAKAVLVTVALVLTDLRPPDPPWLTLLILAVAAGLGHQLDLLARQRYGDRGAEASLKQLEADLLQHSPWWMFALAGIGRVGSAEGELLPAHRELAEEIIARLRTRSDEEARSFARRGLRWFYAGRLPSCPFSDMAAACARMPNPHDEALVLECLGRAAQLRDGEITTVAMRDLGALLRFRRSASVDAGADSASSFASTGTGAPAAGVDPKDDRGLREAASLLNVSLDATSDAIRLAYRRGVARYHPDRLPAGASAFDKTMAEEQMVRFRAAYERLLAAAKRR